MTKIHWSEPTPEEHNAIAFMHAMNFAAQKAEAAAMEAVLQANLRLLYNSGMLVGFDGAIVQRSGGVQRNVKL